MGFIEEERLGLILEVCELDEMDGLRGMKSY